MTLRTGTTKPRQRWALLIGIVAILTLTIATISLAVHDEGVFALEGNAITGGTACTNAAQTLPAGCEPANPQSQGYTNTDWDKVYTDSGSDPIGTSSGAEALAFVSDPVGAGDSILTGGGTKDINDIGPSWLWKQTTVTSVQDKDDIEHAFAAQYTVDKSAGQCGSSGADADCSLLYFGADRFSNSGDAVMGFWFFKGPIEKVGPDANGNGTFTGNHTARDVANDIRGDILVVSDFRAGGKAPSIQVYEWVTSGGSASTHLDQIGGGAAPASCTQAPPEGGKAGKDPIPPVGGNDDYCATANQFVVHSPWAFTPKSNSGGTAGPGTLNSGPNTKFGIAEFMEGGINLSALGLGDQCFSSFLAETRSSHSPTSTLSDFALGGFGSCESSLKTTPADDGGTVLTDTDSNDIPDIQLGLGAAGADVTDSSDLSVTGTNTWSGTLDTYLCGPIDTSATCDADGVLISSTDVDQDTATPIVSDVAHLTSAGYYCFRGEFSSDTNGVDPQTDASTGECFEVLPVQTALDTQAVAASVVLGNAVQDNATLSNTANQPGTNGDGDANGDYKSINADDGAPAGGKITFTLYKDDCSTLATSNDSNESNPQDYTPISGDDTYGPVSFTPDALGTYHWVAQYVPESTDPNNIGTTHNASCDDEDESVTVTGTSGLSTDQDWLPNDTATLTGDANLNGTLTFTLYNDGTCGVGGGSSQYSESVTVDDAASGSSFSTTNGDPASATHDAPFFVTTDNDGSYSWLVQYADDNLTSPDDSCVEVTDITVTDTAP
ncbi:MAG TPA: hypothetical protein VHU77_00780 [Candidatus Limnocylindria bacterium]|jgi:hypothetical protein|nr:hypothetical protein [Candidatus Limnocylindria bacterium]